MAKKILVTGGSGYIGSHTAVALHQKGYELVIIDNLSTSSEVIIDMLAKITGQRPAFEKLDLCDAEKLLHFFEKHDDIAGVIHFAALKAVGESVEFPLKYYHNNLVSLINLLRCMQQFGISNLVFSSSCTVYGQPDELPVNETAPVQRAESPYGNTKQISEEIIEETVHSSAIKAISLRYFNPIGAHESGLIGELPTGIPNNLVPYITQTAIGKLEKLRVFGSDYNTPDGTPIRDYIDVNDLAKAHVVAVERMLENKQDGLYEVFNLGTGKGYTVLETIQTFEETTGVRLNYEIVGRRPGDVEKVWADTTLANLKLGWKAEKGLREMLATAWQWERNLAAGILGSSHS
jgi:UDP-glucose 4-epimerase